jgi:pimeloyl-ACP methyl ester carboxylesterase
MTIVLVHGNPETEVVWDDLVPHLRDNDVVRLSPPGFGARIPAGFDCTADAYRGWPVGELEQLRQPVDLVGHDWGGGPVIGIAMERPISYGLGQAMSSGYSIRTTSGMTWLGFGRHRKSVNKQ